MNIHEGPRPEGRAITQAIRAVEVQLERRRSRESLEFLNQRERFYRLLDQSSETLFSGIAEAARGDQYKFYPGTMVGFNQACDKIFNRGLGLFDTGILDDWLRDRDLKHVFYVDTLAIKW